MESDCWVPRSRSGIVASGRIVIGYDIHQECCRHLSEIGGTPEFSAAVVFDSVPVVALVLPNSGVAQSVIEGPGTIRPGTTILDMTTGDPDEMERMGKTLAAQGVTYIDATVGGLSEQARHSRAHRAFR